MQISNDDEYVNETTKWQQKKKNKLRDELY